MPSATRADKLNQIVDDLHKIEELLFVNGAQLAQYITSFQQIMHEANATLIALQTCVAIEEQTAVRHIHVADRKILQLCSEKRVGFEGTLSNTPQGAPLTPTNHLKQWYTAHKDYPYPTEAEKAALVVLTGLNKRQVSMWFINARRRSQRGVKFVAEQVSEAVLAIVSDRPSFL